MQLRILEIELHSDNPEASTSFYRDQLGLDMYVDEQGLKVFGSGIPDLDLIKSPHFPGRISISFFAEDIQACVEELNSKGVRIVEQYGDPVAAIVMEDPDGVRIEIKKEHG
jgi:catechol 2,3-dioxygenase-like lactoylglutathione lyase family enzyme